MKKLLFTTILTCSCFIISNAQNSEKTELNKTEVSKSKKTLKEKSSKSLSTTEKGEVKIEESSSSNGEARRAKAVVKKSSDQLKIEGAPEGVSTENKEAYKSSKAKWKATHEKEYEQIVNSRKTIIKKSEFDKLSPEKKKIILNNPEQYEITK